MTQEGQPTTLALPDDAAAGQDHLFEPPAPEIQSLVDRYKLPPFTVLDRRAGYWREQANKWKGLGIKSELGRAGAKGAYASVSSITQNEKFGHGVGSSLDVDGGVSIFDPVLCEISYYWFCPPGGVVLDPFAGGSVRGVVAGYMGRNYIGVDLNQRQVEANREQGERIFAATSGDKRLPLWVPGDSREVIAQAEQMDIEFDFLFTCPPYGDLEVYSDDPHDLSTMTAAEFRDAYNDIIRDGVRRLADNTFAAIVVGNYRAPDGTLRDLVGETVRAFRAAGARFYNEAIIVDPVGTQAIRARSQFSARRKLTRGHQQLLVFVKGDDKTAAARCLTADERAEIEAGDVELVEDARGNLRRKVVTA